MRLPSSMTTLSAPTQWEPGGSPKSRASKTSSMNLCTEVCRLIEHLRVVIGPVVAHVFLHLGAKQRAVCKTFQCSPFKKLLTTTANLRPRTHARQRPPPS